MKRPNNIWLSLIRGTIGGIIVLFVAGGPAATSAQSTSQNCGSREILTRCWTPEELRGRPEDKLIIALKTLVPRQPRMVVAPEALCPSDPAPALSIRRVFTPEGRRVVALTFDLCERPIEIAGYDADIVNYLRDHQVAATFFPCGKWMQSHPEQTLQLMADPIFEIGNHSWDHPDFTRLSTREMREQILLTQAQYRQLREMLMARPQAKEAGMNELRKIPGLPAVFRFPYGRCTQAALDVVRGFNLAAVQWDVVSGDPDRKKPADRIADTILRGVQPGSIIICHANARGYHTAEALPRVVQGLRQRGYEFATIGSLLTCGMVLGVPECYEEVPGDNEKSTPGPQTSRESLGR